MRLTIILTAVCIGSSACISNPFRDHYIVTDAAHPPKETYHLAEIKEPEIRHIDDTGVSADQMFDQGYILLGTASFVAFDAFDNQAIAQGQRAGADIITIYSKVVGSTTQIVSTSIPSTQISQTNFTGTVMNSRGGSANFSGHATTFTPTSIPMIFAAQRDQYEYFASFWMKPAAKVEIQRAENVR